MRTMIFCFVLIFSLFQPLIADEKAKINSPSADSIKTKRQKINCENAVELMKRSQLQSARLDEKEYFLLRAVELCPENPQGFNLLGVVYLKQNRDKQAMETFTKAALLDANYYQAHYNQGLAYKRLGKYDEAAASFKQALQIRKDHYRSWKELQKVQKLQKKRATPRLYNRDAQKMMKEVKVLFGKEKYTQAEPILLEILDIQPENPKASLYLGTLYHKTQRNDKALSYFAKTEKLRLEYVYAPFLKANILFSRKDYQNARSGLERTIRLVNAIIERQSRNFSHKKGVTREQYTLEHPNLTEILFVSHKLLGEISFIEEKYPEARTAFDESLRLINTGAKNRQERLHFQEFKLEIITTVTKIYDILKEYNDGITFLHEQFKSQPSNVDYHFQLGSFCEKKNDIVQALVEYKFVFRQDQDNVKAVSRILELVTDVNQESFSRKDSLTYAKALERCRGGRSSSEYALLAKAYYIYEDLGKAIYFMKQAIEKEPKNAAYNKILAEYQQIFRE